MKGSQEQTDTMEQEHQHSQQHETAPVKLGFTQVSDRLYLVVMGGSGFFKTHTNLAHCESQSVPPDHQTYVLTNDQSQNPQIHKMELKVSGNDFG